MSFFQNEIKTHSFFLSINWKDLEEKKIPPPFTPNVVNILFAFALTVLSILRNLAIPCQDYMFITIYFAFNIEVINIIYLLKIS